MRFRARLTSRKLTLFPRSGTTSRTVDSEYLFWAEFLFHGRDNAPNPFTGMVNLGQLSNLLLPASVPARRLE
jgi:hypothetical protein